MPRLERDRAADPSRGSPQATDVFEVGAFGPEVRICETREGHRPRFRVHHMGDEAYARERVARAVARKLRAGYREVGASILLGPDPGERRAPSALALEAMFTAGDPGVLDEVLATTSEKRLASLAVPWLADTRPSMRRALLAYVDDGCDRPGHRPLVKGLFKGAEAHGDDELLAHFAVAFDRLTPRIPTVRWGWVSGSWQPVAHVLAVNPALRSREGDVKHGGPDRFTRATRQYLARRVFRDLRRIAKADLPRYGRLVRTMLALYEDVHLARPEALLDSWTLVHVLWAWSPVLERDPRGVRVAKGRSLAELAPAPYHPAAFRGVRDELLALLVTARSRVVRAWVAAWLEKEYEAELSGVPMATLRALLASGDSAVSGLGAKLLERADGLSVMPVDEWLALLESPDATALATVVRLFAARVSPKRLSLGACAKLACSPAAVVAELGLSAARDKPIATPGDLAAVASIARAAEVKAVREAAARWTLELLSSGARALARPEHLRDLFDSRHPEVREIAAEVVTAQPEHRSLPLWFSLVESPYEDVRALVIRFASEWQAEAGASELEHLAATAILAIHRGAASKPAVMRRLADRVVERPEEADRLLPVLALALRSVRGPERTSALASVARAAVRSEAVRAAALRHMPELTVGTEVVS